MSLKKKNSKKGIEMSFNWIFAFIVGAIILFIAIYFSSKVIESGTKKANTENTGNLVAVLNSLETGTSSGESFPELKFSNEIKINLECSYKDNFPFGKEKISFNEKMFNGKYNSEGEPISITNKYIFSENEQTAKKINIFIKPYFQGFKVSDLIILTSKNYCFYNAPSEIKKSFSGKFSQFSRCFIWLSYCFFRI